ncbi:MAG: SatD family protein [Myxococcota bacterium]
MPATEHLPEAHTIIGDVVASRGSERPRDLLAQLGEALAAVAGHGATAAVQPLTITVGDEFQGAYARLAPALDVTLLLQLRFAEVGRLRFGIGHGEIEFDPAVQPLGQTGSAWYTARAAIDHIKGQERKPNAFRTCAFESADPALRGLVNAYLILRDEVLRRMDARDKQIAEGLIESLTQTDIAARVGIDPAAVSRRKTTNGIDALVAARQALLEALP